MPIRSPGRHSYSDSPISAIIRWRKTRRGRKNVIATLMLTSMIDVFAVLVIFLLQNFSATGEILYMQKDIKLPSARRPAEIERVPIVTLSSEKITLEGELVGPSFVGNIDKLTAENWEISALTNKLNIMRKIHYDDKGIKFPGKINIQADKDLPFILIKRVMFTCAQAGYFNINFAVIKEKAQDAASLPAAAPVK
jgi:biopolymer transport protein ExbD